MTVAHNDGTSRRGLAAISPNPPSCNSLLAGCARMACKKIPHVLVVLKLFANRFRRLLQDALVMRQGLCQRLSVLGEDEISQSLIEMKPLAEVLLEKFAQCPCQSPARRNDTVCAQNVRHGDSRALGVRCRWHVLL